MPRNGSGTYTLPEAPFVPNTTISSGDVNNDFSDIATALTGSVASDGQTVLTGPLKGASGAVGSPSYTFSTETSSGMYRSGAGVIGWSVLGVARMMLSATGLNVVGSVTENGNSLLPTGVVIPYAGAAAPSNWLLCYGQNVSRTTYAALYALIGTTYGSGDGFSTFGIPDLRGRAPFGKDNMGGTAANRITVAGGNFDATVLGGSGGGQNQTLTEAQLAAHIHGAVSGDLGHAHVYSTFTTPRNGAAGGFEQLVTATASNTNTGFANIVTNLTPTGGDQPHPIVNPALILNYIIRA